DPLPGLSIAGGSITEGNSGTTFAAFRITLPQGSNGLVSVEYATSDGTAIAGADYVATTGTLLFGPGEAQKIVMVPVIGDIVPEPAETFFLNLQSPSGAVISNGRGTATILNDDNAPTAAPATISGQITTADGASLGGVVLTLTGGPKSRRTITDGLGRYAFAEVET